MNWTRPSMICVIVGLMVVLTTACGTGQNVPATPTAIPTPIVQITPSLTPLPPSPTTTPTPIKSPTPGPSRTPTVTSTPSPKDMLMAAFNKALANLKTYRVEVPQEDRYIAVQLPDRFLQEGTYSIVKIGATNWIASSEGWRIGTGNLPYFDRANLNWYKEQFARVSSVVLLGPGTTEGVPCIGYSASFTLTRQVPPKTPGAAPSIEQSPLPVKIWFATSDGFPRRVEMAAPVSLTINFFDFNENFNIVAP